MKQFFFKYRHGVLVINEESEADARRYAMLNNVPIGELVDVQDINERDLEGRFLHE